MRRERVTDDRLYRVCPAIAATSSWRC